MPPHSGSQSEPDPAGQLNQHRIREVTLRAKGVSLETTIAELACRILGIGQAQLSKYEKGENALTLELLVRLKAYSGRSIDWIVTGEGGAGTRSG